MAMEGLVTALVMLSRVLVMLLLRRWGRPSGTLQDTLPLRAMGQMPARRVLEMILLCATGWAMGAPLASKMIPRTLIRR